MSQVRFAETDAEIARCFAVMHQLRNLLVEVEFVSLVRKQQSEGYKLAYLEHEGVVVAVTGFRIYDKLMGGRTMYVDDLVTDANGRSKGYGKTMLDWLIEQAQSAGCHTFSLDSGTQRQDAHAFYLRERLRITAFHFNRSL